MNPKPVEKRQEVRRPGQGMVSVRWSGPQPVEVRGKLIDVSTSGFRMAHACATLGAGQVVEFSHFEAKGQARAVWTRVLADAVETGFLVIRSGS